ncbi:MAG: hypothetical protein NTW95_05645 [Candidatus Aminicenantes bacterium]|nr:hypothetical protein [Candidatus Aminicenantes bacterium]
MRKVLGIMETTKIALFKGNKIQKTIHKNDNKIFCRHDYKNAIKVGNIDYQCPLCGKLLDPKEWFLMNSFEFIEVFTENKKAAKRNRSVVSKVRNKTKKEIGRSVISKKK